MALQMSPQTCHSLCLWAPCPRPTHRACVPHTVPASHTPCPCPTHRAHVPCTMPTLTLQTCCALGSVVQPCAAQHWPPATCWLQMDFKVLVQENVNILL